MPVAPWLIETSEKIVVVFDMCSSSSILEELTRKGQVPAMLGFFNAVKGLLHERKDHEFQYGPITLPSLKFEAYKFLGDGWLLLFPKETSGELLLGFFAQVSGLFASRYHTIIRPHLAEEPKKIGVSFGVDIGEVYHFDSEYFGMPLVIASRLQGEKCVMPSKMKIAAHERIDRISLASHGGVKKRLA